LAVCDKKNNRESGKFGPENGREVPIRKGNMISDTKRSQVRTKSAPMMADDGEKEGKMTNFVTRKK
jgi:hypothetical protein